MAASLGLNPGGLCSHFAGGCSRFVREGDCDVPATRPDPPWENAETYRHVRMSRALIRLDETHFVRPSDHRDLRSRWTRLSFLGTLLAGPALTVIPQG